MVRGREELHTDKEILQMYEYWATRADEREREYLDLQGKLYNLRRAVEEAAENYTYAESEIKRRRLR